MKNETLFYLAAGAFGFWWLFMRRPPYNTFTPHPPPPPPSAPWDQEGWEPQAIDPDLPPFPWGSEVRSETPKASKTAGIGAFLS